MTAQALLSDASIVVAPGFEQTLGLRVTNLASHVETFAVIPTGFCAGWVTVAPATLTLDPGEVQSVTITVRPPRAPSITSGDSVLALRVVPHGRPADVAVVEATITVLGFTGRRLLIGQPVQLASRSAVYDVVVENLGNQYANCRLAMTHNGGRLIGRFDPPSVGIEPGQSANSRLRVRGRGRRWLGAPIATGFRIEAEEDGGPVASTSGTFVQTPLVRPGLIGAVIAALVIAGAAFGAWRGVIRPAIDEAVDEAVAGAVSDGDLTDSSPVVAPAPDDTTPGDDSTAPTLPSDPGAVVNLHVTLDAEPGDSARKTIEAGSTPIEISDIILQNPNGDLGTVTIGIGDDALFTFDLEAVYGFEQVELQAPVVVPAESPLVVRLECIAPGGADVDTCRPTVFLSGRGN